MSIPTPYARRLAPGDEGDKLAIGTHVLFLDDTGSVWATTTRSETWADGKGGRELLITGRQGPVSINTLRILSEQPAKEARRS